MTASVRRGDVAARYGGDEFGVLLHGADMETALEVAERIRERVAELWVGRGDAATTISIGVATLAGHADSEELLASADRAMYAAKEGGRNRVVRADTLETAPDSGSPRSSSSCGFYCGDLKTEADGGRRRSASPAAGRSVRTRSSLAAAPSGCRSASRSGPRRRRCGRPRRSVPAGAR